jgi:hypothetical protein
MFLAPTGSFMCKQGAHLPALPLTALSQFQRPIQKRPPEIDLRHSNDAFDLPEMKLLVEGDFIYFVFISMEYKFRAREALKKVIIVSLLLQGKS